MAKKINAGQVCEDKDVPPAIDNVALSVRKNEDDEASLNDALQQNPIRMFFIRLFIKLKNHLLFLPLLSSVLSMVVLTFNIPWHVQAILLLTNNQYNAVLFFLNVLDSLLIVLCFLRVSSKKSSLALRISMMVLFYLLSGVSLFIDYYYIYDVRLEMNLFNAMNKVVDNSNSVIAYSLMYINLHIVFLYVTLVLSILAPLFQPLSRKIHFKIKTKKHGSAR